MINRTNTKILAMGVAAMVLSGGAGAYAQATVANADKVDGRHAVGPTATNAQAAGKLVATGATGRLNARFLPKVGDADRLDGRDSSAYQQRCAPGSVLARTVVDYTLTGAAWSPDPVRADHTFVCDGQSVLVRRTGTGKYDVALAGTDSGTLPVMTVTPTAPGRSGTATISAPCDESDPDVAGRTCFSVTVYNGTVASDGSFAAVVQ
jgi:hypothetical protein